MTNNPFGVAPKLWIKIQNLRLLDNILMQTVLDDFIPGVELILRIILNKPDLRVVELKVQKLLPNLASRDLTLDVVAVDSEGKRYNIEVQRSDSGAQPKRPRYHSALMDVQFLKKGAETDELPETYVIFITENDVLKRGLPLYHIERVITETGELFGDLAHIVYANAAYVGDDEFGLLMSDFRARNPDDMHFSVLADQVREIKSNQKGVKEMSSFAEEMFNEGWNEGHNEGWNKGEARGEARMLLRMMRRNGWSLEQAMEFIGLSPDEKPIFEPRIRELQTQGVS